MMKRSVVCLSIFLLLGLSAAEQECTANADTCDDVDDTTLVCSKVFPPKAGGGRADECAFPRLDTMAKRCRKTCRTCCRDPNYNCKDPQDVRLPGGCTKDICKDFPETAKALCPGTCGLCMEAACRDDAGDQCIEMQKLCFDSKFGPQVQAACKRTCKICEVRSDNA